MNLQAPSGDKSIRGFTLIELLMVIAIVAILGATVIPVGSAFLVRNHLKNKTNEVAATARIARLNSLSGKEGSKWGLKIAGGEIVLFKGDSYAARDAAFDQRYRLPQSITATATELTFDVLTGNASSTATINISSNLGDANVVTINEVGTVNVN